MFSQITFLLCLQFFIYRLRWDSYHETNRSSLIISHIHDFCADIVSACELKAKQIIIVINCHAKFIVVIRGVSLHM